MFTVAHHLAETFPHALQSMERLRDVKELLGFFADDAVLSNLGAAHDLHGTAGVSQFWRSYLDRFSEIRSEFTHLHMSSRAVVLEWCSEGRLTDGQPISYAGVSILAFNPEGKISEFRTYYDSAAFVGKAASSSAPAH